MKILIRKFLPNSLAAMLWGNRPKWGLEINYSDPCWKEWVTTYNDFYNKLLIIFIVSLILLAFSTSITVPELNKLLREIK